MAVQDTVIITMMYDCHSYVYVFCVCWNYCTRPLLELFDELEHEY